MSTKIGERVVAIRNVDGVAQKLYSFGEGVYVGNEVPHDGAGPLVDMLIQHNLPSPKINLDSGQSVYGCECWWGPVSQVYFKYAGYAVIHVDVDEYRKNNGGPCRGC